MKLSGMVVMVLFSSVCVAQPEIKGHPEDLKSFLYPRDKVVIIEEVAEETAYSDTATVNLVITTEEKQTSLALKKNGEIRAAIVEKLTGMGIHASSIKNAKFSSSPQFGWFGKKPDTYKIINRISIKIDDESNLQKIAEVADSYPEVAIAGTIFEHSKKDLYLQQVKEKALAKVMAKKAFYEKSLGVKLIPVAFTEKGTFVRATQGANAVEEVVVTAMRSHKKSVPDYAAVAEPEQPESSFDEVNYISRLEVEFKIQ